MHDPCHGKRSYCASPETHDCGRCSGGHKACATAPASRLQSEEDPTDAIGVPPPIAARVCREDEFSVLLSSPW